MGASHEATFTPEGESSWTPLEFMIPDPQLWEATEAGRYTAVNQSSVDAFAWSAKTFEGDLTISLDIESPVSQSEGCVIIYGRGGNYSYGSLIFCLESEYYQLEKHSRYHEGENFLAYAPSDISFKDMVYSVTIEIKGDTASMFVNGNKVLSTILDLNEIERSGRIGLHKLWAGPEVTFSNIHVNTPSEEEQVAIPTEEDVWDCEKDAGGNIDFYPIDSPFSTSAVQIDGKISSFEEWSNAACVDFRLHYQTVTNPNFQRARWWVQNNETDIFFLVRIPSDQVVKAVMFSYYWPEYTGTWPQSDRIYVRFSGEIFDYCFWDEMNWYKDEEMDPPGNIDLEAAVSEDGDFIWFEIKRPLNSGDGYDWALEPGLTIGYNPYDSLHISVLLEEGSFIRYLQLTLGEP